jgi:hypothetical protein
MSSNKLSAALQDLRDFINREVASGFRTKDEIIDSASEYLGDDYDPDELRPYAISITHEIWDEHLAKQRTWPAQTDCDRLDAAFADLEKNGIVARQDFSCCTNCGSTEIWDEMEKTARTGIKVRGYTFYHMQDTERAAEGDGVYLAYGSTIEGAEPAVQIAREIVATLHRYHLKTDWDGTYEKRIGVTLDWKRRLPS